MSYKSEELSVTDGARSALALVSIDRSATAAFEPDSAAPDQTEQDRLDAALDLTFPASDPVSIRCD